MTVTINGSGTIAGLSGGHMSAILSGDQIIPDNTFTKVVLNVETLDGSGAYDPTTGVFTAPFNGRYLIDWSAGLGGTSITNAATRLTYNGASVRRGSQAQVTGGSTFQFFVSIGTAMLQLNAGDTITLEALVDGTGSGTVAGSSSFTTLDIHLLSR